MCSTVLSSPEHAPELLETGAELAAELAAAIESHTCTVCHQRYSAATNWQCSCFSGYGELDTAVQS
jgi:hypothetical protein